MDTKLSKVRKQSDGLFSEGKFYEAQQLYRSLCARYCTRKKFDEAATLLHEGTTKLLKHQQVHAATELALLLLEVYTKAKYAPDDEHVDKLLEISQAYTSGSDDSNSNSDKKKDPLEDEVMSPQIKFLRAATKWSVTASGIVGGSPRLQLATARVFLEQQDYARSHQHYLRSQEPEEHSNMLIEWSKQGYSSEADLYIARCVLEYIVLEDCKSANCVFHLYCSHYSSPSTPPTASALTEYTFSSPLLHFIQFLLLTVQRDAAPLFAVLKQKYNVSLNRDPNFQRYLDKIGQLYFDIKPQGGMLESLFSSGLLGGMSM